VTARSINRHHRALQSAWQPLLALSQVLDMRGSRIQRCVSTDRQAAMTVSPTSSAPVRISCIICAYNEGPRLGAVLEIAAAHPLLAEVIVVDDGSSDDTAAVASRFANVRLISHDANRGKSEAVATGVAAARHELLMLLDADLKNLHADDIAALAQPVLTGQAEVSMSLRRNSLAIFRAVGIDFVSGERVVRRALLVDVLQDIRSLPRFGIEVFMNKRIIARRLSVAVAHWTRVTQSRKTEKLGYWRGVRAECRMVLDLMRAVYPVELLSQTVRLLALRTRAGAPRNELRSSEA
jgi:glycosyltransferase involved in cell wall biosynthesis